MLVMKERDGKVAALAAEMKAFGKIDPVIHTKARLAMVSVLAINKSLNFTEIRDGLGLTDGNLAAHLKALKAGKIIRLRKVGKDRPLTAISLTDSGRAAFRKYLDGLEQIVKRHR
jgi:DNA-binding MarR family transcriptional regulator